MTFYVLADGRRVGYRAFGVLFVVTKLCASSEQARKVARLLNRRAW